VIVVAAFGVAVNSQNGHHFRFGGFGSKYLASGAHPSTRVLDVAALA